MPRAPAIYNETDASHVVWQTASVSPGMTFGMRSKKRARVFRERCGLRCRARCAAAFRFTVAVHLFISARARVSASRPGA
eukprot:5355464-Pleurochrysis_carterae.AAC.1